MHSSSDDIPGLSGEEVTEIVLSVLLERHPALVADAELAAELPQSDQLASDLAVDAVDELVRLGLAHRLCTFTFASHTAVKAGQLC